MRARQPTNTAQARASDRRAELARIHIGVADLGWSDADYRSILLAVTGKSSAGDLDATGRQRFLAHLRQCGWNPMQQHRPKLTRQQWLIKSLWRQLGDAAALTDRSDTALDAFIRSKGGTSSLRFLGTAQASPVIEALKGWLARVSKGTQRP